MLHSYYNYLMPHLHFHKSTSLIGRVDMFKNPAGIYLLQVNNGNARTRREICSYVNKGANRDTWNNA